MTDTDTKQLLIDIDSPPEWRIAPATAEAWVLCGRLSNGDAAIPQQRHLRLVSDEREDG